MKISRLFSNTKTYIKRKIRILLSCRGKIQNNKLYVMTFDNKFNCNQKYIVEEILRQNLPIDIVWVANEDNAQGFPEGVRTVRRASAGMYKEQYTAKVWLDNALNCIWYSIPKRKGQVYINTWHGSLGIKKLGGDESWLRLASKFNKVTDYMVSNSTFEEDVYKETYWKDVPVLKYGHPRNDILFDKNAQQEIRREVCEHFSIDEGKKILLYAPTFRDDGDTSCYNIDYKALKESLEAKFGFEWMILVRMHFKNRAEETPEECSWLKNAGDYPDMQKLMVSADFGITDYSSWAYDYVLTRRPMILYAPDAEKYSQGRGLYYSLEETPFPLAHNNAELKEAITNFDNNDYQKEIDRFLSDRGCYEKGDAAKRVVEKLKEIFGII